MALQLRVTLPPAIIEVALALSVTVGAFLVGVVVVLEPDDDFVEPLVVDDFEVEVDDFEVDDVLDESVVVVSLASVVGSPLTSVDSISSAMACS